MATCIDLESFKKVVQDKSNMILDAGYTKNLRAITLNDAEQIIRTVFLHSTIFRSMAELDQLKSGLNVFGRMQ